MTEDHYEDVSVGRIKAGDTVCIDGVYKTVGKKDLGGDGFVGPTLWGDSYRAGTDKVTRVTFAAEIARREASAARALENMEDSEPDNEDFPDDMEP